MAPPSTSSPRFLSRALVPISSNAQRADSTQDSTRRANAPNLGTLCTIEWDTDEGTWTGLDVSPDGRTIVFDLLGDLCSIPIDGGSATRLTSGLPWDNQPRFSPDGRHIAFISDRDGMTSYTPTLIVTYGGPSLNAYFTGKMSPHDDPKVRRFTPEERMDEGRRWTWVPEDELFFREIAKSATAISRAGVRVSLGAHGNR